MTTQSIYSWNVNGIRAVYKKNFMDFLNEKLPDILCIQETKAQADQIPEELKEMEEYSLYTSSAVRKGYSGVALFTKTVPKQVSFGFGIERFDSEGRTIIAEYDNFVLYNIYYPNGKASDERLQYKMDFYDAFLEHVEMKKTENKEIIICGDVNTAHKEIDLARPKENETVSGFLPEERAWIDKFLDHGYVDIFREFNQEPAQYSWWTYRGGARERNVGWRIDYFFVTQSMQKWVTAANIHPDVMGSDHCPISIEINMG